MSEIKTLEHLFITEYNELQNKLAQYEDKLREYEEDFNKHQYGFVDLMKPIKVYYVSANGSKYSLFMNSDACWKDKSIKELQEFLDMNDKDFLDLCSNTRYTLYSNVIDVTDREFPYQLALKTHDDNVRVYVVDPNSEWSNGTLYQYSIEPAHGEYIVPEVLDESIKLALDKIRGLIRDQITELKSEIEEALDESQANAMDDESTGLVDEVFTVEEAKENFNCI